MVLSKGIDTEFENLKEIEREKQQFEEPKKETDETISSNIPLRSGTQKFN